MDRVHLAETLVRSAAISRSSSKSESSDSGCGAILIALTLIPLAATIVHCVIFQFTHSEPGLEWLFIAILSIPGAIIVGTLLLFWVVPYLVIPALWRGFNSLPKAIRLLTILIFVLLNGGWFVYFGHFQAILVIALLMAGTFVYVGRSITR